MRASAPNIRSRLVEVGSVLNVPPAGAALPGLDFEDAQSDRAGDLIPDFSFESQSSDSRLDAFAAFLDPFSWGDVSIQFLEPMDEEEPADAKVTFEQVAHQFHESGASGLVNIPLEELLVLPDYELRHYLQARGREIILRSRRRRMQAKDARFGAFIETLERYREAFRLFVLPDFEYQAGARCRRSLEHRLLTEVPISLMRPLSRVTVNAILDARETVLATKRRRRARVSQPDMSNAIGVSDWISVRA